MKKIFYDHKNFSKSDQLKASLLSGMGGKVAGVTKKLFFSLEEKEQSVRPLENILEG